jgi:succinyl-CoA synthetase beta subunit
MFGGITRCDSYAQGIVDAIREKPLTVPLVVRMEGTNKELGQKILAESGLDIIFGSDMKEATQKIVELVKKSEKQSS